MIQLPEQFQTYHISDNLNYVGEDLFDYINGGAELYLSYGLLGMTGAKYSAEGLPQVTVEIYIMTGSKNAFGVYTQSRDKEEYDYGQGSQSYNDFIIFWKDRYFVVITTQKSTPQSKEALHYLASYIDKSITGEGEIPGIVNHIPKQNLVPGGFLYFHHYIWLNAYLFIADYNIININDETDAILAKYGDSNERSFLLMVEYPDEDAAKIAYNQLKEKLAPEMNNDLPIIQLEDKTWFTSWIKGNKLAAIFNGNSEEQVKDLYQSTTTNM